MQVNSPSISDLNFTALFNLAVTNPSIVITNASTGSNLAGCTWWYDVITPNGTYIHQGSSTSPDMSGVWTTETVSETWPQIFNQIEWDGSVPYKITLYVKDAVNTIFSYTKTAIISRPNGNTAQAIGNFGNAEISVKVQCNKANLRVEDLTNYLYNSVQGDSVSRDYVLSYPGDDNGNIPDPFEISGASNVFIPITYSAEGYQIYYNAVQKYTNDQGLSVQIKYKYKKVFNVYCNVDLCPLVCDIQKLYDGLSGKTCSAEMKDKLLLINAKLNVLMIAMSQPLCGYDVPALIEEIKKLGGFNCNCVTIPSQGISGGLDGDIAVTINGCGITGHADVTGSNIVLNLNGNISIFELAQDPGSEAFSIAPFDAGSCTTKYRLNVDIDTLKAELNIPEPTAGCCPVVLPLYTHSTTNAPAGCPNDIYATPLNLYNPADGSIIGVANSSSDLISRMNANTGAGSWREWGIALDMGYCQVGFVFDANASPTGRPTAVHVSAVAVNSTSLTSIKDYCLGGNVPVADFILPGNIWVQYTNSGTVYEIRGVIDYADLLTKLNAQANIPAGVSFVTALPSVSQVNVNVVLTPGTTGINVTIWHDWMPFVASGANHHALSADQEKYVMMDFNRGVQLGKVCGISGDGHPWMCQYSKSSISGTAAIVYFVDTNSGVMKKVDVTDPRNPFAMPPQTLPNFGGLAFSGTPLYKGDPSYFDVFFKVHQDPVQWWLNYMFIHESSSGAIYSQDTVTNNTLVGSFRDNMLIGKQARIVVGDTLYFSHFGDFEQGMSASSGVSRWKIVSLTLSNTFAATALNVITITGLEETDEVWDIVQHPTTGKVYLVLKNGDVAILNTTTNSIAVGERFISVFSDAGTWVNAINTVIKDNRMFVSCRGKGSYWANINPTTGYMLTNSDTAFDPLPGIGNVTNNNHYNFLPVPNKCYGLLTYGGETPTGVARYSLNGNFIDKTMHSNDGCYNLYLQPWPQDTLPNSLC